jgi:hypothetical protein
MENIAEKILIDISKTHGLVENVFIQVYFSPKDIRMYIELFKEFHDMFSWSYEEILGIDPQIVEHEIRTYPNVNHVQQKLRLVNP